VKEQTESLIGGFMKHKLLVIFLAIMAVASIAVAVEQEKPWCDLKNCEFCKPWSTPEMLKNCTWDQHEISNGVMTLALFPESFRETCKKASAQMDALGKRAAGGEKIQMCGSCEMMGSFFMRGAKMEEIPTKSGAVMLLTASDPTLIADMHKWAKRNAEEEKKMKAAEKK
jgi:hypothetical protein